MPRKSIPAAVAFDCIVYKVQTLVDGGIRVALDLPETATAQAHTLMNLRGKALVAHVAELVEQNPEPPDDMEGERLAIAASLAP